MISEFIFSSLSQMNLFFRNFEKNKIWFINSTNNSPLKTIKRIIINLKKKQQLKQHYFKLKIEKNKLNGM
jgi:hypothetical protein